MAKFLDSNGLLYLWSKIKAIVPTKTSDLTNDSGFITASDIPEGAAASTTVPKMDGTATAGTELAFARGDHIHPTDTSRQAKITASGILKGDGNGGVSAATAGTDYATPESIPGATTTSPKMDGTAAVGSETKWAKGDHVHPHDTSKQDVIDATHKLGAEFVSGLADVATSGKASDIEQDASNRFVSDTEKTTWSGKQDKLSAQNKLSADYISGLGSLAKKSSLSASEVGAVAESAVGAASGVCPLGADSLVPNQYLPSYVDDVIEAYIVGSTALAAGWLSKTQGGAALTPETGKIYVIVSTGDYLNKTYRWGGTTYVQTNPVDVSVITNSEIDTIVAT